MKTEIPVLEPLPTTLWLVHHPGNRPYLGALYEDRHVALHAKRSFEVVIEIQLVDDAPTFSDRMTAQDHLPETPMPNKPYDRPMRGDHQCQCQGCFEYFTRVSGFEKHRYGAMEDRKCLTPDEMRAKGWSQTGTGFWMRAKPRISLAHTREGAAIS